MLKHETIGQQTPEQLTNNLATHSVVVENEVNWRSRGLAVAASIVISAGLAGESDALAAPVDSRHQASDTKAHTASYVALPPGGEARRREKKIIEKCGDRVLSVYLDAGYSEMRRKFGTLRVFELDLKGKRKPKNDKSIEGYQEFSWVHTSNLTECGIVGSRNDGKIAFIEPRNTTSTRGSYKNMYQRGEGARLGGFALYLRPKIR